MFSMNVKATEQVALLGAIVPSSQAAGTAVTGWLSASDFQKFLGVVQAGAMGAGGTIDAKIQQAQDGNGTNAKDVPNKAITELAAAGGGDVEVEINLDAQELDTNNGFGFIQLSITTASAASGTAGLVFGFLPRYGPASDFNAATVAQIVG